ncbi:MAG: hypothetical protein ACYSRP_04605 [Planctomycetota bacterium]|jgi:hypothetical protein
MTYFEPETEKRIIERLDRMKAKIDAFVASLEEPFEQKGQRIWVRAGVRGKICKWRKTSGEVRFGDVLCYINTNVEEQDRRPPVLYEVESPDDGYLDVPVAYRGDPLVGASTVIAYIIKDD